MSWGKCAIAAAAALICAAGLFYCKTTFDNPVDPLGPHYIGDDNANDRTPPALTVTAPDDSALVDQEILTVFGSALDANDISGITVNGQPAALDSAGHWSLDLPLSVGANTIAIRAVDGSIHRNEITATRYVTRAAMPGSPSGVTLAVSDSGIVVSWQDNSANETGFIVQRRTGSTGGFDPVDTTGANVIMLSDVSTFTPFTAYYYRVIAVNAAGQSQPSAANVIVYQSTQTDQTGPEIVFRSPQDGATLNQTSVEVSVDAVDASGVQSVLIAGVAAINAAGRWTGTAVLTAGSNIITVVATDNSSRRNQSTRSIAVIYDPGAVDQTGPTIAFNTPAVKIATVTQREPLVSIDAADPSGVAAVHCGGAAMTLNTGTAQNGTYSLKVAALAQGPNILPLDASDGVGNISRDTLYLTYDPAALDSDTPTVAIFEPQANARFASATVSVSGTAADATSGIASVTVNGIDASYSSIAGTWNATAPLSHGVNTLSVAAADASSGQHTGHASVNVIRNQAPVFTSTRGEMDKSILTGSVYTAALAAGDPDGDACVYNLLGTGRLISPGLNGAAISATAPAAPGIDTVTAIVTDQYGDADTLWWVLIVSEPSAGNLPPQFSSVPTAKSIPAQASYVDQVTAIDPNAGDVVRYSLAAGCPAGMSIDSLLGTVQWTPAPADAGPHAVSVIASDGKQQVSAEWTVTVVQPNRCPTFVYVADTTISEPQSLTLWIDAADPDSGQKVSMVSYAVIPPDGTVRVYGARWQYSRSGNYASAGLHTVVVRFTDNGAPACLDSAVVRVHVVDANRRPGFDPGFALPASLPLNQAYVGKVHIVDPDGDSMSITARARPAGMTLARATPDTLTITWTPTASGSFPVNLELLDGKGGSDTLCDTIAVVLANQAPYFAAGIILDNTAEVNVAYVQSCGISDPEGGALTATLLSALTGATANYISSRKVVEVQWTPVSTQVGNQTIRIMATDPGGLSDTMEWMVLVSPPNHAPAFDSSAAPKLTAIAGFSYIDTIHVGDVDGDSLWVAKLTGPSALALQMFSDTSVRVSFTPAAGGNQSIKLRLADEHGLSDTLEWTVAVKQPLKSLSLLSGTVVGGQISCMAVDSLNMMFAGTSNYGLFRSINGGATWDKMSALGLSVVGALCFSSDKRYVYAGDGATSAWKGLWVSSNDGAAWTDVSGSYGKNSAVTALFGIPGMSMVLAGMAAAPGIHKSSTGGVFGSWASGFSGTLPVAGFAYDAKAARVYAIGRDGPAYSTLSSSGTWASGTGDPGSPAYCLEMARNDNRLILGSGGGVYVCDLPGGLWAFRGSPLPTNAVARLHVNPSTGHVVVAFSNSQIWTSIDNGDSWSQITGGETSTPVGAIASDRAGAVYIGYYNGKVYKAQ